jgi:hypothetical protein
MMTTQTAAAIARMKASVNTLRRIAANVADWQDADAINREADVIVELLEGIEIEAQDSAEDHRLLARAA